MQETINKPQASVADIQAIYDRAYNNPGLMGTQLDVEYSAHTKSSLLALCADAPNSRLLDLGTGDGDLWQYAPAHAEWHALDISEVGVRRTKQRFGRIKPAVAIAEHLPYPDGFFGSIVAADTIEHVIDLPAALNTIYDKLAKGGNFALSLPTPNSLRKWAWNRFVGERPSAELLINFASTVTKRTLLFGKPAFQPIDRDLSLQQWSTYLTEAGFVIHHMRTWPEAPLKPIVFLVGAQKQ